MFYFSLVLVFRFLNWYLSRYFIFLHICFILIEYLRFLLRFRFSVQNIARAIKLEKLREIERQRRRITWGKLSKAYLLCLGHMRSLDVMNKNTFVNVCRELFLTLVTLYRPSGRRPKVIFSFQTEMDLKTGNISTLASSEEALVPVYPGPSPRPPCRCSSRPPPASCSSTSSSTSYSHWTGTYIHCHWVKALVSILCCKICFGSF